MTFDARAFSLREGIVGAALHLLSARHNADNHPEDPHSGDALDYASDHLESALDDWFNYQRSVVS